MNTQLSTTVRQSPSNEHDLTLHSVTKTYARGKEQVPALRGISLGLPAGCQIALMGPSGCGKTTLLHCMAGIIKPTSGSIMMNEIDITRMSQRHISTFRLENFGFVFQDEQLLPELTNHENVALPLMLAGHSRSDAMRSAWDILERIGITALADSRPGQVSGGQAQRVAIARALVTAPSVVFADEPTGSLDQATGHQIMQLLSDACAANGTTLVLVTHDQAVASFLPHTVHMRDGLIVTEGARQ